MGCSIEGAVRMTRDAMRTTGSDKHRALGGQAGPGATLMGGAGPHSRLRKGITLAAIVGVAAVGASFGVTWYRERPLAEAEAAMDAGDYDAVFSLVSPFLQRYPDNSRALALKARMLVLMRDPSEAIRIFDRIGAANAKDLHAFARAYLLQEHWSVAMPLLEQTARLDPNNADALYELTSCRMRLGFLQEALDSAQRFAELSSSPARGYVFLGSIQNDLKNRAEAASAYAKALELEPDATNLQVPPFDFLDEYARTLLALGRGEEASALLEKSRAIRHSPRNWTMTGRALAGLGRSDEAAAAWRAAIELDPNADQAREDLAGLELRNGNPDKALEWLAPLESRPVLPSSAAYLFQRAHTLRKDEEKAKAWAARTEQLRKGEQIQHAVESVLVEAPQTFWARVVRAYRFAQQGNWVQARTLMATASAEESDDPFVRDLARALEQRGDLPPLDRLPIHRK
ncbi:MAG: tetratricopeptide repeat protein [Planctomycetes bacterium]|nr:tetratricopeptide repeat protein [Planctomycetota bacterium]